MIDYKALDEKYGNEINYCEKMPEFGTERENAIFDSVEDFILSVDLRSWVVSMNQNKKTKEKHVSRIYNSVTGEEIEPSWFTNPEDCDLEKIAKEMARIKRKKDYRYKVVSSALMHPSIYKKYDNYDECINNGDNVYYKMSPEKAALSAGLFNQMEKGKKQMGNTVCLSAKFSPKGSMENELKLKKDVDGNLIEDKYMSNFSNVFIPLKDLNKVLRNIYFNRNFDYYICTHQFKGRSKRRKNENIVVLNQIHFDIDQKNKASTAADKHHDYSRMEELIRNKDRLAEGLKKYGITPTDIIITGGGIQIYFKFIAIEYRQENADTVKETYELQRKYDIIRLTMFAQLKQYLIDNGFSDYFEIDDMCNSFSHLTRLAGTVHVGSQNMVKSFHMREEYTLDELWQLADCDSANLTDENYDSLKTESEYYAKRLSDLYAKKARTFNYSKKKKIKYCFAYQPVIDSYKKAYNEVTHTNVSYIDKKHLVADTNVVLSYAEKAMRSNKREFAPWKDFGIEDRETFEIKNLSSNQIWTMYEDMCGYLFYEGNTDIQEMKSWKESIGLGDMTAWDYKDKIKEIEEEAKYAAEHANDENIEEDDPCFEDDIEAIEEDEEIIDEYAEEKAVNKAHGCGYRSLLYFRIDIFYRMVKYIKDNSLPVTGFRDSLIFLYFQNEYLANPCTAAERTRKFNNYLPLPLPNAEQKITRMIEDAKNGKVYKYRQLTLYHFLMEDMNIPEEAINDFYNERLRKRNAHKARDERRSFNKLQRNRAIIAVYNETKDIKETAAKVHHDYRTVRKVVDQYLKKNENVELDEFLKEISKTKKRTSAVPKKTINVVAKEKERFAALVKMAA